MQVEIRNADIVLDAALIGNLFDIPPADVPALMKTRAITSVCERGTDEDEGRYRLLFFYGSRRARLSVDSAGQILQRSVIDFGQPRKAPAAARAPE
jgi:hypothetical protein